MGLVRRGLQFQRAVKGAGRLRHIIGVLTKHGFGDVVHRLGMDGFVPNKLLKWVDADKGKNFGERLRLSFEELGPAFVKLGQVLSMRPDLVPEHIIEELIKLQDNVSPLPGNVIREILTR
jgi:ubiquinone biosynthesis protein